MIEFNDNNLVTAYIKQLLHTFNLPTIPVYIENETKLVKDKVYIKDNFVNVCISVDPIEFKMLFPYIYNREFKNYTKTLTFSNMIYDSHTHEYLGEYLRFLRDYKQLDLMSLYNCFSDNVYKISSIEVFSNSEKYTFKTDSSYKLYSFPVKLGKKYTIAISSGVPYTIFCGLCGKEFIPTNEASVNIEGNTLVTVGGSYFDKPFIYDKLTSASLATEEILQKENCLRMFLYLPFENNSSITVLEGEFLNTNDRTIKKVTIKAQDNTYETFEKWVNNTSIVNFDDEAAELNPKLISALQLLYINSKISHPFADKLIQYLCGNVIDNLDEIGDNIKRVQSTLVYRDSIKKPGLESYGNYYGIWQDIYRKVLYAAAQRENILNNTFDVLGYVDKDIEKMLLPDEVDIYKDE